MTGLEKKIQIIVKKHPDGVFAVATPETGLLEYSNKDLVNTFIKNHPKYDYLIRDANDNEIKMRNNED